MADEPRVKRIHVPAKVVEQLNRAALRQRPVGPVNPEVIRVHLVEDGAFYEYSVDGNLLYSSPVFVTELVEVFDKVTGAPGFVTTNAKGECIRAAQRKYPNASVEVVR